MISTGKIKNKLFYAAMLMIYSALTTLLFFVVGVLSGPIPAATSKQINPTGIESKTGSLTTLLNYSITINTKL